MDFQSDWTIISELDAICEKYPNQVALVLGEQQLTYGELHKRTQQSYDYLTTQGWLSPNSLVGLCFEPSFEIIIAIYTIWKAGAAFVPLDPNMPCQRLAYIIADAGITTILTPEKYAFNIQQSVSREKKLNLCFIDDSVIWQKPSTSASLTKISPIPVQNEQLAYVIYTSGSTGEPKGVAIAHQGLMNLAISKRNILNFSPGLRVLQFASWTFDAAIWELTALCSRATLILADREQLLPGYPLARFINRYRIQVVCLPPSILGTLTPYQSELSELKIITVAGEVCPITLAHQWSPTTCFFNAYGPTEATVCVAIYPVIPEENYINSSVPIGYAIPNMELYVLDNEMNRCIPGVAGQLYIGGVGLAQKYINKPDLTNTCFLENPFGRGKIYKTGDIAYEDSKKPGLFHFVGRIDNQIKLRGFRIELEAIEATLTQHPNIQIAVVKAIAVNQASSETKILIAYVVCRDGCFVLAEHLRQFTADRLPHYMVPSRFIFMDEIPLMPNRSKINRQALPLPCFETSNISVISTNSVTKIIAIFEEILKLDSGICTESSNFFELGGDSLYIARILHAIEHEFKILIPSRLIYEHPTPISLGNLVEKLIHQENNIDDGVFDCEPKTELSFLLNTSKLGIQPTKFSYDTALITGATGFFGSHVLYNLLTRGNFKTLYCLVRADNTEIAKLKLEKAFIKNKLPKTLLQKVIPIVGDITEFKLNLSQKLWNELGNKVNHIYHCAADISYIKPLSVIQRSNIEGTKNIIALAAHGRQKVLHYVSTLAVYGATKRLLDLDVVDENFDLKLSEPIISIENAYTRTKWIAEYMVQVAREKGLAVSIYRPGFIEGHSLTGVSNLDDTFCRLILGCIQMGLYPDFPEKYWLPTPVDYAAAALAHISLNSQNIGENYNLLPQREQELSHVQIFEVINQLGYSVQKVSPKTWLNALTMLSVDNMLYPLVSFLREKIYQDRMTILEVHAHTSICQANQTLKALQDSNIVCPQINKPFIAQYLDYLIQQIDAKILQVN
ncbi:MAG: amino acid adenylation domain-containing protein [Brasilonema angustatum HA4187-MV1]|jgi:amino acid adenylation domain-containing protein/thioester reductase-like protein|nr:amino acid adenylation domain-containing protein [Brasilonema angustatum HA4187-MV1]